MRETEKEQERSSAAAETKKTRSALGIVPVHLRSFKKFRSDFVVDISGALRRHLLNYVDRVAVVAADLLVVRAEDAVSSPERDDDVAGLRTVIVPTTSAPFGGGQGA